VGKKKNYGKYGKKINKENTLSKYKVTKTKHHTNKLGDLQDIVF